MVLDDQDWALPQIESISPNNEELLLLDWILSSASGLIPGASLDDLMERLSNLRMDVWKGILEIKNDPDRNLPPEAGTVPLLMDDFTARVLLAIVPTTFRWGTGADCGYSLKIKLYNFLTGGIYDNTNKDQTDSGSENQSPDPTGPEA